MELPTPAALATRCNADGEFHLASRYWDGSLYINIGDDSLAFAITNGTIAPGDAATRDSRIGLTAATDVWEKILAPVPPPFFNDIAPAAAFGLVRDGSDEIFWQYYPAVRRLIDLLREEVNAHATL